MMLGAWWYRRKLSELQLVHWGTKCIILCNFAVFLPKLTDILENEKILVKILRPRTMQRKENLFFDFIVAKSIYF